jgi:hypothetical protein
VYVKSFGTSRENSAEKEVAVFRERFPEFCESPGFSLVTAGNEGRMVGFGYRITLPVHEENISVSIPATII